LPGIEVEIELPLEPIHNGGLETGEAALVEQPI